ncbi:hypothetical protein KF840_01150 [bacterium]|nr:hypothetical protein [bacterium]
MRRPARLAIAAAGCAVVLGGAGWYWQSELIGVGARWYLERVAAREEASGSLAERRAAVARMHGLLLLSPPPDALVPELFDLITAVSSRVASGAIDFPWAAYVYNSYERDLARDRPLGVPRRSRSEVEREVARYVDFYALRKRPDVDGVRLRDLAGAPAGESFTVEEIEQAAREGRDLTRE